VVAGLGRRRPSAQARTHQRRMLRRVQVSVYWPPSISSGRSDAVALAAAIDASSGSDADIRRCEFSPEQMSEHRAVLEPDITAEVGRSGFPPHRTKWLVERALASSPAVGSRLVADAVSYLIVQLPPAMLGAAAATLIDRLTNAAAAYLRQRGRRGSNEAVCVIIWDAHGRPLRTVSLDPEPGGRTVGARRGVVVSGPDGAPVGRRASRFPGLLEYDLATGVRLVAGADEVGRACLAGPLVAAACLFEWDALTAARRDRLVRLDDSKELNSACCRELRTVIEELAVCVAVCVVTPAEIDRDGLHVSNLRALQEVVSQLRPAPGVCFSDGYAVPAPWGETTMLVGGDRTSAAVAAASVVAKARRDELMAEVASEYPQYGFGQHQGYITPQHNDAIRLHGPTRHHRRSYNAAIYRELGLRFDGS
jgi:ribonuclease HII